MDLLIDIFEDLRLLRNIDISKAQEIKYIHNLKNIDRITINQLKTAREWIRYGEWSFRGRNPELVYQDFFPSQRQLESITINRFVLMTVDDKRDMCKRSRDEGYFQAEKDFEKELLKRTTAMENNMGTEHLTKKLLVQQQQIFEMKSTIEEQANRVDELSKLVEGMPL